MRAASSYQGAWRPALVVQAVLKHRGRSADSVVVDAHHHTSSSSSPRERAFTLVELLVAMSIVAILIGVGIYSIRSARSSGKMASALASAQAYADAVDAYAREHGDKYPTFPGEHWTAAAAAKGPVDPRVSTMSYLRRIPENVQSGSVIVSNQPDATKPTIVYVAENSGTGYRVEVHVPGGDKPCALRGGNATSTTPRTCSER